MNCDVDRDIVLSLVFIDCLSDYSDRDSCVLFTYYAGFRSESGQDRTNSCVGE